MTHRPMSRFVVAVVLMLLSSTLLLVFFSAPAIAQPNNQNGTDLAVTQTSPLRSDDLLAHINDARTTWDSQNVESYLIQVTHRSAWNIAQVQVRVRDGQVVELRATCEPGPASGTTCSVGHVRPRDYIVPALFETADNAARFGEGRWTTLRFYPGYSFPSFIEYDDPEVMDDFYTITVDYFSAGGGGAPSGDPGAPTPILESEMATATALARNVPATQTAIALTPRTPMPTRQATLPPTAIPTRVPSPTLLPTLPPVQPPFDDDLPTWIDAAEAEWDALGINDYDLVLRESGAWTGMELTLIVRDGSLRELRAVCQPGGLGGPCWLDNFRADDYLVHGLFDKARIVADMPMPMFNPLAFDAMYHFPIVITFDELDVYDEQWNVRVLRFEPR
ncbi:MAG: hypothetical protein GYB65_02825 [Chloroflexi bacterium]|nr:hypothetical protein [Chloroflexota bacterium]